MSVNRYIIGLIIEIAFAIFLIVFSYNALDNFDMDAKKTAEYYSENIEMFTNK